MPVKMPPRLEGVARAEWKRLAPKLKSAGLLTDVDVETLALYCELIAQYRELQSLLVVDGPIVTSPTTGARYQHPALSSMNRCRDLILKFARRFGLDPDSRHKMGSGPAPAEVDEMAKLLAED